MPNKQSVILKGRKDGITIWLDEHADFTQIRQQMQKKVAGARHFFAGADAHVAFTGRTLSDEDEKTLLDIILAETTLELTFVEQDGFTAAAAAPNTDDRFKVRHAKAADADGTNGHSQTGVSEVKPVNTDADGGTQPVPNILPLTVSNTGYADAHVGQGEYMTAFYPIGLRSGQSIRYHGSVVVTGDVNPGSEIVADGNIVVLGRLKGMVHAGAAGDDHCFVSALSLMPTQLRIAGVITYIPRVGNGRRSHAYAPVRAYMRDGQVYIAPL